jgi:hypothetical protein
MCPKRRAQSYAPCTCGRSVISPHLPLRQSPKKARLEREAHELWAREPDAQVTSEGSVDCYLVVRRQGDRLTLLSSSSRSLADEGRALLVFGDPWAAEAFRTIEGLGQEWEVIGPRPLEVTELLETSAANGVGYVEIDPPSKLTRGKVEPRLVPVRSFVDYLLSE